MRRLFLGGLVIAALAMSPLAAHGSVGGGWQPGSRLVLPSNATVLGYGQPVQAVLIDGFACSSPGNCLAAGSYVDVANQTDPVLATEISGHWGPGIEPSPPSDAASNPQMTLGGLACVRGDACIAVGRYLGPTNPAAMILTESAGTWSALTAPLPSDAVPYPNLPATNSPLTSIACDPQRSCTAVGSYETSQGAALVALTGSGQTWQPQRLPLPGNAWSTNPDAVLSSVSCAAAGDCVAVGSYIDGTGETSQQGLLLTETAGSWSASEAPLPADAVTGTSPNVVLNDITCPSAGNCTAIGTYGATDQPTAGLLLAENSGMWTATEAPLPSNAGTDAKVRLNSIACPSTGNCVAAGRYNDASQFGHGLILTESAGQWTAATPPLPAGTPAGTQSALDSVSCPQWGYCAASGRYNDASNNQRGLLLNETGGVWSPAEADYQLQTQPAADAEINFVSCPAVGICSAAGSDTIPTSSSPSDYGLQGILLTLIPPPRLTKVNPATALISPTRLSVHTGIAVTCPRGNGPCNVYDTVRISGAHPMNLGTATTKTPTGTTRNVVFTLKLSAAQVRKLAKINTLHGIVSMRAHTSNGPYASAQTTFSMSTRAIR